MLTFISFKIIGVEFSAARNIALIYLLYLKIHSDLEQKHLISSARHVLLDIKRLKALQAICLFM